MTPARLVGWLHDGTVYFAPLARMSSAGDRVCCHLCGRWFLSVASHIRVHGWRKDEYLAAFGLELSNALCGQATHKRRAAALTARSASEGAVQRAQRVARVRARSGELAVSAAAAARGRAHPPERRPKTLAALAAVRPEARAAGNARRGREEVLGVAASVAARFGYDDFAAFAADRLAAGASMSALSREAGLHKDWVSRHLELVAPSTARTTPNRRDLSWLPTLERLGFDDVAVFLRTRHVDEHRTVAAIAHELGVSRSTVDSALARHGIRYAAHATTRHRAAEREVHAVQRLGFESLPSYVTHRRSRGVTWQEMAAETGLPASTLRRRNRNCLPIPCNP